MGFNKRYISEEVVVSVYKQGGYEYLVNYIIKPDALLIRDDFSNEIVNKIKDKEQIEKLMYGKL